MHRSKTKMVDLFIVVVSLCTDINLTLTKWQKDVDSGIENVLYAPAIIF